MTAGAPEEFRRGARDDEKRHPKTGGYDLESRMAG